MKRPTKVRLWGVPFKINYEASDGVFKPKLQGLLDPTTKTITVCREGPPGRQEKTLLHELLHASFNHIADEDHKEETVIKLENALWALFADNPHVVEWMLATWKRR